MRAPALACQLRNELTYCVWRARPWCRCSTSTASSPASPSARGEMFHIDSGSLHHIENIGEDVRRVHPRVSQRTTRRLSAWQRLRRDDRRRAGQHLRPAAADLPRCGATPPTASWPPVAVIRLSRSTAYFDDPHKIRRSRRQSPPIGIAVGSARLARTAVLAGAQGPVDVLAAACAKTACANRHWHPVTAEMGYVHSRFGADDGDGSRRHA